MLAAHAVETTCTARFPTLWSQLRAPRTRRTITFVCHPELEPCGGIGDRLGGIVSVAAYSLVSNRTLLIDDADLLREWEALPRRAVTALPADASGSLHLPYSCRACLGSVTRTSMSLGAGWSTLPSALSGI